LPHRIIQGFLVTDCDFYCYTIWKVIDYTDIIEKAKAGDSEAFGLVYAELYTPVFKYIYARSRDKELSENITNDVFMRFYTSIAVYKTQKETPLSYLFTIARNLLINYAKKKRPRPLEEGELESAISPGLNQLEKSELSGDVTNMLEALTQIQRDQREVIELKYLSELSNKEIAEMLGKTEANIRQLESRGLRKLRDQLENHV
jgi:RNA polymerase sigma-70 factor, ECF subfamily